MKFLSIIPASLVFFLGGFVSPSYAQESRWGSPGEETVKFIIAAEAKWANSACSPQPDLKDLIADVGKRASRLQIFSQARSATGSRPSSNSM